MTQDNIINLVFGLYMALVAMVGIWQTHRLWAHPAALDDVEMRRVLASVVTASSRTSTFSNTSTQVGTPSVTDAPENVHEINAEPPIPCPSNNIQDPPGVRPQGCE